MREKQIIFAAKVLSVIFTPFYLPLLGLAILLAFTYLSLLPLMYKALLLLAFWVFTVFVPTMLIRLYRRYQGWSLFEIGSRERRVVPYVISIVSYLFCYYLMAAAHVPHFMGAVLIAALVVQVACARVNLFINISTHTAAIGGVAGALASFSLLLGFNPVWWLCLVMVVAGLVGTSRMILRQHSLREIVLGFLVGAACSFASVVLF